LPWEIGLATDNEDGLLRALSMQETENEQTTNLG